VAQPGSKVNLVTDSIRMLWDISQIRWLHRNFQATPSRKVEALLRLPKDERDLMAAKTQTRVL
jgi:hypothetical protein